MKLKHLYIISLLGLAPFSYALDGLSPIDVDQENSNIQSFNVIEGQLAPKSYRQQPPLIPHKIEKYQINLNVNQCLRCHDWPFNTQFNAPKVSETHYVDRQGAHTDKIAPTRWFCTQCHVTQQNAPELIENMFKPAEAK